MQLNVSAHVVHLDDIAPDLAITDFTGTRIIPSQITEIRGIGESSYSKVFESLLNNERVATKKLLNQNEVTTNEFRREVLLLGLLNHPCIIKIKGICLNPPLMIVFELCQYGELYRLLHDHSKSVPWLLRLKIALDIAKAIKYLHDISPYPVAHLNLKSPNVMLYDLSTEAPVRAKLIDFGTAQFMEAPITIRKVNNQIWLAPEILAMRPYDHRVDTYAFGVICYEILTRKVYFSEQLFSIESVINGERPVIDRVICHATFIQIIEDSWCQEPLNRPKFSRIIKKLNRLFPLHEELDGMIQKYDEMLNQQQEMERDKGCLEYF